jgi:predicted secreted protein
MHPRRPFLRSAAALTAVAGLAWLRPALAQGQAQGQPAQAATPELAELSGLSPEGVQVDFPRLADTGAAVPLEAALQAPAGTRIARIDVYLPLNPNTHALKMSFPEPVAGYRFATRLRLAHTQDAWVVMTLTDGSRRGNSAPTIITSSACFDES